MTLLSGKGDKNLLEIAELIQGDDDLFNFVQKELNEPWLTQITIRPPFQKKMMAMMAKCGNQLLKVIVNLNVLFVRDIYNYKTNVKVKNL